MQQIFRLALTLIICIPLALGVGLDSTVAGPLTDLRRDLPEGITMKVLGSGSFTPEIQFGNSNQWGVSLGFERVTLLPNETIEVPDSPVPNRIAYFYVDRGIVGISVNEDPSSTLLLEGGSVLISPDEEGYKQYDVQLRGEVSSKCTNVLILFLNLCQACAGGAIPNREATSLPEDCLEPIASHVVGKAEVQRSMDFFMVRVTMNPGTSWDLSGLQPTAGVVIEKGTLTGVSSNGDEAEVTAGESLTVSGMSNNEGTSLDSYNHIQNVSSQRTTFVLFAAAPENSVGLRGQP